MDSDLFEQIVEEQIHILRDTLIKKGIEYATCDRLHNFRTTAKLQQGNMKQALGGFMAKHTVSLYDMMYDGGDYSMEQWNEKIGDHIAYLFLLKAVCVEEDIKRVTNDDEHKLNKAMDSYMALKRQGGYIQQDDDELRGQGMTTAMKQGGRSYDASTKGTIYPR